MYVVSYSYHPASIGLLVIQTRTATTAPDAKYWHSDIWTSRISIKKVKAGDYTAALKKYHFVIIYLKGISNQESFKSVSIGGSNKPKITEVVEDEDEDDEEDEDENDEQKEQKDASHVNGNKVENSKKEILEGDEDKYSFANVKKTMVACYVNMAICHSKTNAWAKCKRSAERWVKLGALPSYRFDICWTRFPPCDSALQIDQDNFKVNLQYITLFPLHLWLTNAPIISSFRLSSELPRLLYVWVKSQKAGEDFKIF